MLMTQASFKYSIKKMEKAHAVRMISISFWSLGTPPVYLWVGSPHLHLTKNDKWLDQIIEWERTVEQSLQEAINQIPIVKLELLLIFLGTSSVIYNVVTKRALRLFNAPESKRKWGIPYWNAQLKRKKRHILWGLQRTRPHGLFI